MRRSPGASPKVLLELSNRREAQQDRAPGCHGKPHISRKGEGGRALQPSLANPSDERMCFLWQCMLRTQPQSLASSASVALAKPCCLFTCFVAWSHCKSGSFFFQMLYQHHFIECQRMRPDPPPLKLHSVNWRTQCRVCPKDWLPDVSLKKAENLFSTSEHVGICGFL